MFHNGKIVAVSSSTSVTVSINAGISFAGVEVPNGLSGDIGARVAIRSGPGGSWIVYRSNDKDGPRTGAGLNE